MWLKISIYLIFCVFIPTSILAQYPMEDSTYTHTKRASSASRFLVAVYKMIGLKKSAKKQLGSGNVMTRLQPIRKIRRQTHFSIDTIQGRAVYHFKSKKKKHPTHLIYLHGGAYTEQFVKQHWKFILKLVKEVGVSVIAADYPLAPQATYAENLAFCLELYAKLGEQVGYDNIILIGDSAGGGLAAALAIAAKDQQLPQPKKIILLSPWLDLSMSNLKIAEIDPIDPMLNLKWVEKSALAYTRGDTSALKHPWASPLYADLQGLAPVALFIGGRDVLEPDCKSFQQQCQAYHVPIHYYFYPKMVHVWMLAGFLPEAKICFSQIVEEIKGLD